MYMLSFTSHRQTRWLRNLLILFYLYSYDEIQENTVLCTCCSTSLIKKLYSVHSTDEGNGRYEDVLPSTQTYSTRHVSAIERYT